MKTGYGIGAGWRQWVLGCCVLLLAGLAQAQPAPRAQAAAPGTRTILVMGDSLSAAYGLRADQGWVALADERIAREHPGWRVVNASISGDTSAGGASRIISEVLRHRPAVVVIALGANDALRGLPLRELHRNLGYMIGASQFIGAEVLLVGMRMPPNLGAAYTQGFERTYRTLAALFDVELLPFLLEPIASDRNAFQADNLHPVAGAQPALRDHVWSKLQPMLAP
ncbi:MAG: arylesterase [Luteimonas sp.]